MEIDPVTPESIRLAIEARDRDRAEVHRAFPDLLITGDGTTLSPVKVTEVPRGPRGISRFRTRRNEGGNRG